MKSNRRKKGFTLMELLVAMTVAAVLVGVSLNVYETFCHGVSSSSINYVRFATEQAKELRCKTCSLRGLMGSKGCREQFLGIFPPKNRY